MDPNATLAEARGIVASVRQSRRNPDGVRLAELVEALDDWLTHGGFLPTAWATVSRPTAPQPFVEQALPCSCGPGNSHATADYNCPRHRPR